MSLASNSTTADTAKSNRKPSLKSAATIAETTRKRSVAMQTSAPIEKEDKKRKLLSAISKSSGTDKHKVIESGRVKFINSELRISNMKKLKASNCIIIGDNNTVFGDDNTLIGTDNKAIGNGNKFTSAAVKAEPSEPGAATPSVAMELAAGIRNMVAQQETTPSPAPSSYYSTEFLTLPHNWICINGVFLYQQEDIKTFTRYFWRMMAGRRPSHMPRSCNFFGELILGMPLEVLRMFSRLKIPSEIDVRDTNAALTHALTTFTIPMPPGMPPCRVAPVVTDLVKLEDPDAPPPAAAAASNATLSSTLTSAPLPPAVPTPPVAASRNVKPVNKMPVAGENPNASKWKVSALDLGGSPTVAAKDEPTCRICLVNVPDVIFEECHHIACCRECVIALYQTTEDKTCCPVCRQQINCYAIVYHGS